MLITGTPLQIYNPEKECEYMLVGIFLQINGGFYEFVDLSTEEFSNFFGTQFGL